MYIFFLLFVVNDGIRSEFSASRVNIIGRHSTHIATDDEFEQGSH